MEESAFYDLQHIPGACFYADSAGDALRSIRAFFSLDHYVERTRFDAFAASGTELFVDHVHALRVLLDGSGFTGLCAFSALDADHRLRLAFLPVSYTHLDVYKRQVPVESGWRGLCFCDFGIYL